jgi:hypothetical protein
MDAAKRLFYKYGIRKFNMKKIIKIALIITFMGLMYNANAQFKISYVFSRPVTLKVL